MQRYVFAALAAVLALQGCANNCSEKDQVAVHVIVSRKAEDGATEVLMTNSFYRMRTAVSVFWKSCSGKRHVIYDEGEDPNKECHSYEQHDDKTGLCVATRGITERVKWAWSRAGLADEDFEPVKHQFTEAEGEMVPYEVHFHKGSRKGHVARYQSLVYHVELKKDAAFHQKEDFMWVRCDDLNTSGDKHHHRTSDEEIIRKKGVCPATRSRASQPGLAESSESTSHASNLELGVHAARRPAERQRRQEHLAPGPERADHPDPGAGGRAEHAANAAQATPGLAGARTASVGTARIAPATPRSRGYREAEVTALGADPGAADGIRTA